MADVFEWNKSVSALWYEGRERNAGLKNPDERSLYSIAIDDSH